MAFQSDQAVHLLNQGAGYGVLLGVGGLFAGGMILTTRFLSKYLHENAKSTETFSVANRSVKTPLTTSAVYSSWSWADELLWCATMVYNYGIQASFYYGAGLCIQIAVMATIGIHAKKKMPKAHTSLEIVGMRYGNACHILFMFLSLVNNLLSCASMILAASGAISIIAGNLNIAAATMLIPFGVILYTAVGGLKATFLTDFVHTLILLTVLCYFNTAVLTSELIGGLDGLYKLMVKNDGERYIEGNYKGSAMTGKSQGALFFGLILTAGNFGLTVMDSSFWQKTFSSDVRSTVPAYLIAAVLIFANVWPLGVIIGSASIVLENTPAFPTYPRAMNQFEIDSGYVLPYVLKAVLGNGGVGALLLVIYLAVTSTVSSQMISVSSIISYDIYRKYINPQAQNKHMIRISHFGVVFFGLFSAGFALMLHYVGVDMTWMGYFMSMAICPGVIPLIFTITWDKQPRIAAFVSPIVGMICGIAVWLSTAYHYFGVISIVSTGAQLPCLFGSMTALLLPGVVSIIITLIKPEKFDWALLNTDHLIVEYHSESEESTADSDTDVNESSGEKKAENDVRVSNKDSSLVEEEVGPAPITEKELDFYIKVATIATVFILLVTWVLWPLPLYRNWVFSEAYFKGYVVMGLVWVYAALLIVGIYPIIAGRESIAIVFRGIYRDYIRRDKA